MLDSIDANNDIHVANRHWNHKSYGVGYEIENGHNWHCFCQSQWLTSVKIGVESKNYYRSDNWQHFHQHLYIGPNHQKIKVNNNLLLPNVLNIELNIVFPTIIFDYPYSWKILVNASWSFIQKFKLILPHFKSLF